MTSAKIKIIHEQIPIKNIYIYLAFSFNQKCVQFIDYLIILTTILRKLICNPEHPLKVLFKGIQETLVHAPKLWAEEISKRASLAIKLVWENNCRVPRRSFV